MPFLFPSYDLIPTIFQMDIEKGEIDTEKSITTVK